MRRHWLITWIILAFSPIVPNSLFKSSASASARDFARNFQEDEDVIGAMEDKSSSSAPAVVDFEQSKGNDGMVDSAAFGGGHGGGVGRSTDNVAKSVAVTHPAASWLEFTEWLERGLDDCGLEPTLYARCVLSILKQPPETALDTSADQDDDWIPTSASSFLSVVPYSGKNNSAPSSRKNSFSSLASAAAAAGSFSMKSDQDTRKQALLDCLKTINSDEADLEKFVDDIVQRYSMICKPGMSGEKQNESVDSGVCPSPEESFQNYDEAFPPLATDTSFDGSNADVFIGETLIMRPRVASSSWISGKRPAENNRKSTLAHCVAPAENNDDIKTDDDQMAIISGQGDGSPVKRAKLHLGSTEIESGGRSLRSCPDFVCSSGITAGAPTCTEKRATFCCPVVKKQSTHLPPTASVKIPPQFVIPKFWKVGSWPSRYDRTTKPAGDVPFWSCSEWFCTVHKRLEFGLLNARINGETKSLAASKSSAPPIIVNASCGSDRSITNINPDTGSNGINNFVDVEIFEIEPPLPSAASNQQPLQQIWNVGRSATQQQQECEQQLQVVPEMFDAPRFILHIINEDENGGKENSFPPQQQNNGGVTINHGEALASNVTSDWTPFFENTTTDELLFPLSQKSSDNQYGNNVSPWTLPPAQSEFSFSGADGNGSVSVSASTNTILPVDVSRMASSGVGFCLPKCGRYPFVGQQQQQPRQPQALVSSTATAAGFFNKLLENQPSEGASSNEIAANPKQQPQSVAVPIRESTHFRPIRSESMEDAYYLKPGFDEFCANIENIEGYYVYQNNDTSAVVVPAVSMTPTAPVARHAASVISKDKVNVEQHHKRSLALKFRAANPDKMCQTEEEEMDFDAFRGSFESEENKGDDVAAAMENQWYSQEFEIWAYQPKELMNNLTSSRWNLDDACENNDGMVVGVLSPHIDDGWLNDLVASNSPPPTSHPRSMREERPSLQSELFGRPIAVENATIPQQPTVDGQQQLNIWQQEDERYEDSLLRYVSNISLISPLDIQTTTV